jgi:hypothetical protein
MTVLPDCEECGNPIVDQPYEIQGKFFCCTDCAMRHYRNQQAERLNYQKTVYRVPDENTAKLAGHVC